MSVSLASLGPQLSTEEQPEEVVLQPEEEKTDLELQGDMAGDNFSMYNHVYFDTESNVIHVDAVSVGQGDRKRFRRRIIDFIKKRKWTILCILGFPALALLNALLTFGFVMSFVEISQYINGGSDDDTT